MVSKARLDLPDPESPVTTISLSRGISTEMFLRLWTRAPCTAIVVRADLAAAMLVLELIRRFPHVHKRQLLHEHVAPLGELDRRRNLGDQPLVGQVLARRNHSLNVEVPLEVALDLRSRPRLAHLAQMLNHRPEQRRGALDKVLIDRIE